MTKPQNAFSWNELMTEDVTASAAFYRDLFGWRSEPFETLDKKQLPNGYQIFKLKDQAMGIAGMIKCPTPGAPSQWIPYVVVAKTDDAVAQAKRLGAEILLEPTDIPDVGRIAVLRDPQGAILGVHQITTVC